MNPYLQSIKETYINDVVNRLTVQQMIDERSTALAHVENQDEHPLAVSLLIDWLTEAIDATPF